MHKKKILSSVIFFLIGIFLFWLVYRDFNVAEVIITLKDIGCEWVLISIVFGLTSHYIRALRWKMLITTMDHNPRTLNLFLSVIILYFTNLIIPRGGEISRCAIVSKYEGIPFVKLLGTVFIERIVDLIVFIIIFIVMLIWQFSFFKTVFNYPEFKIDFSTINNKMIPIILTVLLSGILVIVLLKYGVLNRILIKLRKIKSDFLEGVLVIVHLKGIVRFFIYTLLIFLCWFLMLYTMFFAYPATAHLTFMIAIITYTFANLAYLLPIQAGIGTWHFIVISCLFFYGIDKTTGMIFALIAHTFTNLIYLGFGPITLSMLPIINIKKK